MKRSELKQIIKEEIKSLIEAEDPIQTAFRDAIKRSGTELGPSSTGNRLKEKEYTFLYTYRAGLGADNQYDDEITVSAPDKETALNRAWEKLKNKPVIKKAGLTLLRVK